jgi:hypothetical protein
VDCTTGTGFTTHFDQIRGFFFREFTFAFALAVVIIGKTLGFAVVRQELGSEA